MVVAKLTFCVHAFTCCTISGNAGFVGKENAASEAFTCCWTKQIWVVFLGNVLLVTLEISPHQVRHLYIFGALWGLQFRVAMGDAMYL